MNEEEKRKEGEEEKKDVIEVLVEELRLLRMAIEAHTRALYFLAGSRRYGYRGGSYGGYSYRGGRRGGKRYGYLKNT